MAQVGHAKPDTLLPIYAQVMQRDRAKIGSAVDALMAGAALPAETAIGPMIANGAKHGLGHVRRRGRESIKSAHFQVLR